MIESPDNQPADAPVPPGPQPPVAKTSRPVVGGLQFRPWEVIVAFGILAYLYARVSQPLRFGPIWLLPLLFVGLLIAHMIAQQLERPFLARRLALSLIAIGTIAIESSIAVLVRRLIDGDVQAPYLLRDAALLWIANVIVFGIWYWELDGGGPGKRLQNGYQPTDLAFPQIQLGPPFSTDWQPGFVDYLFCAFTASAAFSPTDVTFLSQRAKILMMVQAAGSIIILAVVAARAVNILK